MNYQISETDIIQTGDDWFSTGCYGNEEFYAAVCASTWNLSAWILNPYSAILAGGDEQDESDSLAQVNEAKRLLDESWEKYKANCRGSEDDSDLILNSGKAIWPIGG